MHSEPGLLEDPPPSVHCLVKLDKKCSMLRPGFEPGSSARKAGMIGRTTLPERHHLQTLAPYMYVLQIALQGPSRNLRGKDPALTQRAE
jgi:hypothetical protein